MNFQTFQWKCAEMVYTFQSLAPVLPALLIFCGQSMDKAVEYENFFLPRPPVAATKMANGPTSRRRP
jgi:hypothetical protein